MKIRWYGLIMALLFVSCRKEATPTQLYWTENIGSDKMLPLLPDSNVNYFLYSFSRTRGAKIGIRIKGRYGYARYMSYNVYDNNTINSVASMVDTKIVPDAGSQNPFLPTADFYAADRNYAVNIYPNTVDSAMYSNALLYDDDIENIGIILRYYLPVNNKYAAVDLPEIEAFDIATGRRLPAPLPTNTNFQQQFQQKYQKISILLHLAGLLEAPKDIFFYKFSGVLLYPNLDNNYLFAPVTFNKNQVMMLRFKAPTFAANNTLNGNTDVRYFSICLSDAQTYTYSTTTDLTFKVAASDAYINIVIGDEDAALRAKAAGLNYIVLPPELKNNVKGLIIYRNLLTRPDFSYPMSHVPDVSANINLQNIINIDNLQAQTYMADYAPIGIKMTKAQFLSNFGGFSVSY